MKVKNPCWWSAILLITASLLGVCARLPGCGQAHAGLSAVAQAGQKDLPRLTVGYTPISGAALPFFIAVEEKIFQKYGFEVAPIFMGGSPLINSAILAGEFPIGFTGGGAVISSRLGGSDLIVIGSPLPVLTIDGWAKPEIKAVTDLKGKIISVTRIGASSYYAGLSMLESAGLKTSDVAFVQSGGVGESMAALLTGRVDASMIGYPFGIRAQKAGFHMLFRPSETEYGLFPTAVIAARESWFKDLRNRKVAVDFLRALHEGLLLSKTNSEVSKKALGKYTRVHDEAALQGTFEFYRPHFSSNLRVIEKAMANALKFLDHPKAKQADPKQTYTNSLVEEALK
ncbi:MAG: ABC transporter substrate-binding protein [Candidatus Binatia bacterium]